jgi:hypothetical protein
LAIPELTHRAPSGARSFLRRARFRGAGRFHALAQVLLGVIEEPGAGLFVERSLPVARDREGKPPGSAPDRVRAEVLTVGEFYEIAADGEIIFT